jgi:hypothetical protein
MSGVDTAHAAGFVDSDLARVNSPTYFDGALPKETLAFIWINRLPRSMVAEGSAE